MMRQALPELFEELLDDFEDLDELEELLEDLGDELWDKFESRDLVDSIGSVSSLGVSSPKNESTVRSIFSSIL